MRTDNSGLWTSRGLNGGEASAALTDLRAEDQGGIMVEAGIGVNIEVPVALAQILTPHMEEGTRRNRNAKYSKVIRNRSRSHIYVSEDRHTGIVA
ncbi:hypothetical protein NDU88_000748 [Pleurodeles waltl]|uniref:Uncharacterized protein n=1 Tax=Pleurodeles waltl TaxID=8319 RepID=A0AAV7VY83_PLEWA|nr:hypothetical protein NDU88_000748 [Pleurodeles waltl]